ncbi:hypothetical protein ACF2JD_05020 [Aeromonas sp. A-5]|uniref:hypothetical protein n=1 Tax=Aeromonas ichthyocola TaxID=3367746 RepID=UPI0038E69147
MRAYSPQHHVAQAGQQHPGGNPAIEGNDQLRISGKQQDESSRWQPAGRLAEEALQRQQHHT